MKYFLISIRSLFFYIVIIVVYKIMGKREVGELSIIDLIVSLLLAQLVAIAIENYSKNVVLYLMPIIILVFLQKLTSKIYLKSKSTREVLEGKPTIVVNKGELCFDAMKKQNYNLDDLLTSLREKEIKSLQDVDYALLETNGKLSIFKKDENDKRYPLPIIQNGEVEEETLKEINKSKDWLIKELKKKNILLENVFYAFYQEKNLYIIENSKVN